MFDFDDNDFNVDEIFSDDEFSSNKNAAESIAKSHTEVKNSVRPSSSREDILRLIDSHHTPINKKVPVPVTSHSRDKSKRRKFPGPAGLLPERRNVSIAAINEDSFLDDDSQAIEVCSQGIASQSLLEDEPWQRFLAELDDQSRGREVLDCLNVASIKRKASARLLFGHKIPFLAAILHEINCSSPDPFITLRDPTGEMSGTLHRDVWQQFGDDLVVGSVLVLTNTGVLSVGTCPRRHYLNITGNNIATIYTAVQNDVQKTPLKLLMSEDFLTTIENWRANNKPQSPGPSSPSLNRSPTFSVSDTGNDMSPASSVSLFSSNVTPSNNGEMIPVNRNNSNFRRNTETVTNLLFNNNVDRNIENSHSLSKRTNTETKEICNRNSSTAKNFNFLANEHQNTHCAAQKINPSAPSCKKVCTNNNVLPVQNSRNNMFNDSNNCTSRSLCSTPVRTQPNIKMNSAGHCISTKPKSVFQPKSPMFKPSQDMFLDAAASCSSKDKVSSIPFNPANNSKPICNSYQNNLSSSNNNMPALLSSRHTVTAQVTRPNNNNTYGTRQICNRNETPSFKQVFQQTRCLNKANVPNLDNKFDEFEKSQVESTLEGLDADSFFDEDF